MGAAVEELERCGADLIHCDVMDGSFVPKITFGSDMIAAVRAIPPCRWTYISCASTRSSRRRTLSARARTSSPSMPRRAARTCAPSCATSAPSACARASPSARTPPLRGLFRSMEEADMLLVMSVYPGRGGQKLLERTLAKAEEAKNFFASHGMDKDIEMDGRHQRGERRRRAGRGGEQSSSRATPCSARPTRRRPSARLREARA